MPTKPRTKKPAAKPQRKPRKAPTSPATAEDIGRSIGNVLGRKLDDLLAGREVTSAGVHAWTVEKDVDKYIASAAAQPQPSRKSALYEAVDRLRNAISAAEVVTDMTHNRLGDVLGPPTPTTGGGNPVCPPDNASALVYAINEFADRIYADNRRRNELLDRLEL